MLVRCLADYRAGDDRGALDWAEKCLRSGDDWCRHAQAQLVRALAHRRRGEAAPARESLAAARKILADHAREYEGEALGDAWHDWLICQALLRAVEGIGEGATSPGPTIGRE